MNKKWIFLGALFLFVIFYSFSSINFVSATESGTYSVCCSATDVQGGTTPTCNFVVSNSSCAAGQPMGVTCPSSVSKNNIASVIASNSAYHSTSSGCDFGCASGEESCWVDGSHYGCITSGSGTYSYSGCTGTYYNSSNQLGYCEYNYPRAQGAWCGYTSSSSCNNDHDCYWIAGGYSSCSGLPESNCTSTSGCTVQTDCTYSSTGEGGGLTCSNGQSLCSGTCVNLNTNTNDCGSCGNVCNTAGGEVCNSGVCGCPVGQTRTQTGVTFASCSGTYSLDGFCSGTYVSQLSFQNSNGGNNIQELTNSSVGSTGPSCTDFYSNETLCNEHSGNGCNWTIYTYSCSGLPEDSCNSTSGCTSNYDPVYSCATPNSCNDTDGGINYTVQGTVTANSGAYGTDVCTSSTQLGEYYCNANKVGAYTLYTCPNGCLNGACKPVSPTCNDTDGGVNYNQKGTVKASLGVSGTDYCFSSSSGDGPGTSLTSGDSIREYACNGNSGNSTDYACPNGCLNGACKPATESFWYDYNTYRKVSTLSLSVDLKKKLDMVVTTYETTGNFTVVLKQPWYTSDIHWGPYKAILGNITNDNYTDSYAPYTVDAAALSQYTPTSSNGNTKEYDLNFSLTTDPTKSSALSVVIQPPPCSDTDGGDNITVPGTVTADGRSYKDLCFGSSFINEYYCSNNAEASNTESCGFGSSCEIDSSGQAYCKSSKDLVCSDTDGGVVYGEKGTVTANSGDTGTDYCFNSTASGGDGPGKSLTSGNSVREFACNGSVGNYTDYVCPDGCLNGACTGVALPNCRDSDGNSSTTPGIVNSSGQIYKDTCLSGSSVKEYICLNDNATSSIDSCPSGYPYCINNSLNVGYCSKDSQLTQSAYWSPSSITLNLSQVGKKSFLLTLMNPKTTNGTFYVNEIVGYSFLGSPIYNSTGNFSGSISPSGNLIYNWTPTISDFKKNLSGNVYEYTFDVEGVTSNPNLKITLNGEIPPIIDCSAITTCSDYSHQFYCTNDKCGVAGVIPGGTGCSWDSLSSPPCNTVSSSVVGNCTYYENPSSDNCSNGFLNHSWTVKWTWGANNSYDTNASSSFVYDNGSWHYDPNGAFLKCRPGSSEIACPAQIQLSFFDWRNLIAVIVLVFVLYVIFENSKRRKRKKVSKKKNQKKVIKKTILRKRKKK